MSRSPAVACLIPILVLALAGATFAAWADALLVSAGAVPAAGWAERASLARLDLLLLVLPALCTGLLIWVWEGWRRRWPEGAAGGARAGLRNLAGWTAAFLVFSVSGFDVKGGWIAGALVAGLIAGGLAGRMTARRGGGADPGRSRWFVPLAASFLLFFTTIAWPAIPPAGRDDGAVPDAGTRENVILIVVDALRADHLGAYGHDRPTSPAIDSLAGESVLFERAIAPSSWTLPAMASVLSSLHPGMHGSVSRGDSFPREVPGLLGLFRQAGYRTGAFAPNPWLKRAFGFDRGAGDYFDIDRLGLSRRLLGVRLKNLALHRLEKIRVDPELVAGAGDLVRRSLGWIDAGGGKPFFLYLHFMDVHSPYDPPAPYHGRFCRGHRFEMPDHLLEARFRSGRFHEDPRVLEHVLELYDEGILHLDTELAGFFSELERREILGRTHVVLTADHGEEFLEHGETSHGKNLYQEVIRVPLLVKRAGDGGGGRRVGRRVTTLDILPTLLELGGIPVPEGVEGESLTASLRGEPDPPGPARPIGSQLFLDGTAWTALLVGEEKLISRRGGAAGGKGGDQLYRLDDDPRESRNLIPEEPGRAGELLVMLKALEQVWGVPGAGAEAGHEKMDPETLRQIEALGYVN